jgi:hypothetical protein
MNDYGTGSLCKRRGPPATALDFDPKLGLIVAHEDKGRYVVFVYPDGAIRMRCLMADYIEYYFTPINLKIGK